MRPHLLLALALGVGLSCRTAGDPGDDDAVHGDCDLRTASTFTFDGRLGPKDWSAVIRDEGFEDLSDPFPLCEAICVGLLEQQEHQELAGRNDVGVTVRRARCWGVEDTDARSADGDTGDETGIRTPRPTIRAICDLTWVHYCEY